ncbi:MAG: ABC transporter ATP-binding protein [Gammaproteobacteria bacterium WSBS_2016_MAG_OTU1]
MSALLSFDNVSLFYGHIHALRGVSLHIDEGETIALIGANGAGKSSILRAITGLSPIHSGSIHYEGKQLHGKTPPDIVVAGISMVPEGRRVFPHMSVCDNLLMGAFMRKDKAEITYDLEKVMTKFPRLKERFRQSASTMSGGEQQMLVIGRALMARPKLLLLDEPSLGIAPKLVQSIARSIVQINSEDQVSVILVEQNSRMALKISHRAYALSIGEVLIEGNSKELQQDDRIRKIYLGMDV